MKGLEGDMIMRIKSIVLCFLCAMISAPCFAFEDCPKDIGNFYECTKYLERQIIKDFPSLISRKGNTLEVKMSDDHKETFKDDGDADARTKYSFVKYFPTIQYGLLHTLFYEGHTYDLIDMKTGKRTNVGGYAVLSPDKRRIAVSNVDISAGFSPNILTIYFVTTKGLIKEFEIDAEAMWGPDNLKWKDNKTISFNKVGWKEGEPVIIKEPHTLHFTGQDIGKTGKWEPDSNLQINRKGFEFVTRKDVHPPVTETDYACVDALKSKGVSQEDALRRCTFE